MKNSPKDEGKRVRTKLLKSFCWGKI